MNNSANNVANVNTDGYIPLNTTISETTDGATKANTSLASSNGSTTSQTDLTKEITDQISIEKVSEANVESIRTQDQMFGSLLDIKV
jgi:flagellar hook protein FlgE